MSRRQEEKYIPRVAGGEGRGAEERTEYKDHQHRREDLREVRQQEYDVPVQVSTLNLRAAQ